MMNTSTRNARSKGLLGALAALILIAGFAGQARAEAVCAPFPSMPWLGAMTHEKVSAFVDQRHGGDWVGYIATWRLRIAEMERIHASGQGIRLKNRDVTLSGDGLKFYISRMRESISVMDCLSHKDHMVAQTFNSMETAAGGVVYGGNTYDRNVQANSVSNVETADSTRRTFNVQLRPVR